MILPPLWGGLCRVRRIATITAKNINVVDFIKIKPRDSKLLTIYSIQQDKI
jgi:hypothetical protein